MTFKNGRVTTVICPSRVSKSIKYLRALFGYIFVFLSLTSSNRLLSDIVPEIFSLAVLNITSEPRVVTENRNQEVESEVTHVNLGDAWFKKRLTTYHFYKMLRFSKPSCPGIIIRVTNKKNVWMSNITMHINFILSMPFLELYIVSRPWFICEKYFIKFWLL